MKFCFFGNIADALKGKTPGGAELQVALLAKALAEKGHEVVIIDPFAEQSFVTKDGIKLLNIPNWNKGIKGLRLFLNRIPTLKKILLEQNADYYYARMRTFFHFFLYKTAKKIKSKFILAIAHDIDGLSITKKFRHKYSKNFNLFNFLFIYLPNDIIFHYLLKKADYITIQHLGQNSFTHSIQGKIILFPNIIDDSNLTAIINPAKEYFIHVGTLTIIKGVKNLYELNHIIDKKNIIWIVGAPGDDRSKKILMELTENSNILFKGRLGHAETIQSIANSKALINLSNFEGFPNIFLEAWATGVPVISLYVDPGNVISKYGLGICCKGDLRKMKRCIETNETSSIDRTKLQAYIKENHSYSTAADRFIQLLTSSS